MSQGGHSESLLLLALFYRSTPSCLKVMGWGQWWWGVVAHVILVSAQILLVLTSWLKIYDFSWSLPEVSLEVFLKSSWRRSLPNLEQEFQSRKKKLQFFSLNLLSIPRDIPWHHWKNLLTSKRGRSGGFNFFTKSGQIWLETSGGSRDLNLSPICKCHTISETSWCPYEALHNLIDLRGH